MNYKLYVFCPDDAAVIDAIVNAAANAGAGVIGSYTPLLSKEAKGTGLLSQELNQRLARLPK